MTLLDFAVALRDAGVTLLQLRDKTGSPGEVLARAGILREVFEGMSCRLIMNDRADLALLAGFDGVHVGQGDLSPEDVLKVGGSGRARSFIVGVSTHTAAQVLAADAGAAAYVAIGPVFATASKADAAAVVGLEGVRRAGAATRKPLVAIGGITLENAASVVEAGADAVAVISGLFVDGRSVEKVARDFLRVLG